MMLVARAWFETRTRFALAAAVMTATWLAGQGSDSAKTLFVMLAIVLGGGSLRQERALGTAGFTLALPVTRRALVAARVAVGFSELAVLAAIPVVAGKLAVAGAAAWAVCGAAVLAAAFLVSTLVASEYAAWLVCFFGVVGYQAAVALTALQRWPALDLFRQMTEARPVALAGFAAAAAVLVCAAHLCQRRSQP